jgi:hypothetical protein
MPNQPIGQIPETDAENNQNGGGPPPSLYVASGHAPERKKATDNSKHQKNRSSNPRRVFPLGPIWRFIMSRSSGFWQALFSGLLFGTTLVQWYYLHRGLQQTQLTTNAAITAAAEAKRSADASEDALTASEKQFEISTRPYVIVANATVVKFRAGERIQIKAQVRNSGRTPAMRLPGKLDVVLQDTSEPLAFEPPKIGIRVPPDVPSDSERPIIFTAITRCHVNLRMPSLLRRHMCCISTET